MRPLRHAAVVAATALPLLALTVWAAGARGVETTVAVIVLWALGVGFLAWILWRDAVVPCDQLLDELGAVEGAEGRWAVRELVRRAEEAEARAEEDRAMLAEVVAGFTEGVLIVDRNMRILLANEAARRFAGSACTPGTTLPEAVRDPEVLTAVRGALKGERPSPVPVERPTGIWEVRVGALAGGGAVVELDDVSVVRRSAELRRQFVQDLTHELRSPLAALRAGVEGLADELDPEWAALVVRQVDRLTRLADELAELASIETGEMRLVPERIAVREVAEEVAADCTTDAQAAEVSVHVEIPARVEVVSDRRALARILRNLVENAIRYNRPGGHVRILGERAAAGVRVEVVDTGIGIPAEDVQSVFQRFYRIDRGRTPGNGGLGLGLAIVKHLTDRLGGHVTLASREAVGTTVTLHLPDLEPELT